MKNLYFRITLLLVALFSTEMVFAQTDGDSFFKNLKISGYADIFYKADFNKNGDNTKTSFTVPDNSIEPAMFSLKLVHTSGKFSATADLGLGSKIEAFDYAESGTNLLIKQLYIDYNATDKLKLTAGSWTTHIGYELLDAPDNDIYSMSYAFSYGPFFHTGLKANYTEGSFNIMAGVANPTDLRSSFKRDAGKNFDNKYFIWQLGYAKDKLALYLNGQQGSNNPSDSNVSQFDFVGTYQVTDKFKIGANATLVDITYDSNSTKQKWSSYVGYLKYQVSDLLALNYRAEYLDNKDNYLGLGQSVGNTVFANTISATLSKGSFQLKPEFRFENSSEKIYADVHGKPLKSSGNFLIAALYSF
ncbi:Putative beta-barrel porin-2, OmpL-like. bbp2 [Halpernia humi]|uniref:Putative beta-barrel porin-2, OmpL-like. bbp2 n=1 Tax=Halpernia humi TaxID=493375 RepID=A0A1H5V435_9FLAO|nr:outer membrane beta-barrel protein [Halpernia humi]SEF81528.1 Putative beta-barrel porin-2, OmpL-like. bbp2 [Halpernia humi]